MYLVERLCYLVKILLSVPARSLFMFSLCRTTTISGIAVAAISNGQRLAKFQVGVMIIARANMTGKATEAAIEASEIYRDHTTTRTHIARETEAQIV